MRFRLVQRGKALRSAVPEANRSSPAAASAPPKAADLDNPYGRYYGTARSREDLKKQQKEH